MNSDDFKAKFIEEMKKNNSENLKKATEEVGKALGGKTSQLQSLLNDDQLLNQMTKNMSSADLQKIGQVINNPELLKMLLSSDKGKKAIKDIFEK